MSKPERASSNEVNHYLDAKSQSKWWHLSIDSKDTDLVGQDQVLLSPHIINLRPAKEQITEHKNTSAVKVSLISQEVNFVKKLVPSKYSLVNAVNNLWPRSIMHDLSLFLLIEVGIFIGDLLWLASLYFFITLYDEIRPISKSISDDINTFKQAVKFVFTFPFRVINYEIKESVKSNRRFNLEYKQLLIQSLYFAVLALVITLPLKGVATLQNLISRGDSVVNLASSGFQNLEQAGSLLSKGNTGMAQEQLSNAQQSFNEALLVVNSVSDDLSGWLSKLPVTSSKLDTARNILLASKEVTDAASLAADTLSSLNGNELSAEQDFGSKLGIINNAANLFSQHLSAAKGFLSQVNESDLPREYAPRLAEVLDKIDDIEVGLSSILTLPTVFNQILSNSASKTYVVIFQNTSELRATGGFAGSLALIEFAEGEVKSINIPGGGPYDFQGSLKSQIRPPDPLRLVRGTWQLQDANWFFDFPTSAQKIMWFIKESGGPETDGVIALNSDVVVNLLKLTGPIELAEYGKVLTADNFMRETQSAVEIEYDREENRPKQFIADLAPILFNKVFELKGQGLISLSALINSSLIDRGIQLYSADSSIQSHFIDNGWAGQVINAPADYLAIVRTNIGGGKTDSVIREKIDHSIELTPTGELVAQVKLTRTHNGDPLDTFESRRNVSYLRFYVPEGSTLLATQGFTPPLVSYFRLVPNDAVTDKDLQSVEIERGWDSASITRITNEFGKTVFGNWLSLSPGETKTVIIKYKLPFTLKPSATWQDLRRYTILFQRQAGVQEVDFSTKIIWPEAYRLRWQETSSLPVIDQGELIMRSDWHSDEYYGIILEKLY